MFKQRVRLILKKCGFVLIAVVFVLALIDGLVKAITPLIQNNKSLVENFSSHLFNHPIHFKKFTLKWLGIDPLIELEAVTITHEEGGERQAQLEIEHVNFSINLLQSLLHLRWLPDHFFLSGTTFTLQQHSDRSWWVKGVGAVNDDYSDFSSLKGLLYWLATQSNITIDNMAVNVYFYNGDKFLLKKLKLQVRNDYLQHDIVGVGQVSETAKKNFQPFRFVLTPKNIPQGEADFGANFYLKAPWLYYQSAWAPLLFSELKLPIEFQTAKIAMEMWGKLRQGRVVEIQSKVKVQDLTMMNLQSQQHVHCRYLGLNVFWQAQSVGWVLFLNPTTSHFTSCHIPKMALQFQGKEKYRLNIGKIFFDTLKKTAIFMGWYDKQMKNWDQRWGPSAEIKQIELNFHVKKKGVSQYRLIAAFHHLHFFPYKKIPGIENMAGNILLTPNRMEVQINAHKVILNDPYFFNFPHQFQSVISKIIWHRWAAKQWVVEMPLLKIYDGNIKFQGQMEIVNGAHHPRVYLNGYYQAACVDRLLNYIPKHIISRDFQRWLIEAFQKGKVMGGIVRLSPSDFHVALLANHLNLHYSSKWPVLEKIQGLLKINNRQLTVEKASAMIAGNQVKNLRMNISDLRNPIISVKGEANGNMSSVLKFIQNTPLPVSKPVKQLMGDGKVTLDLEIQQSLKSDQMLPHVQGKLHFEHDNIQSTSLRPFLENIFGDIVFHDDAISSFAMTAKLFGQPIILSIPQHGGVQKISKMRIEMDGKLNPDAFSLYSMLFDVSNKKNALYYHGLLAMDVSEKKLFGYFGKTHITLMSNKSSHWQLHIENDRAKGSIIFPTKKTKPWLAHFRYLDIVFRDYKKTFRDWKNTWNLSLFPSIHFHCQYCFFQEKNLGAVDFMIKKVKRGILIESFKISNKAYVLALKGGWLCDKKACFSSIDGRLVNQHLGAFLQDWKLTNVIHDGYGKTLFFLHWPGPLYQFKLAKVSGNIAFNYVHGRIVRLSEQAESKLGLGKLLNLLSLQSLPQNLLTGFTRIGKKGFEFAALKGEVVIREGMGHSDMIKLSGPLAWAKIHGNIDFIHEEYDWRMRVTPNVTSSLPMLVGLAGGPLAGAVAWLVNQWMGPHIGAVAASEYSITGSIKDPKINNFKQMHDDGGKTK